MYKNSDLFLFLSSSQSIFMLGKTYQKSTSIIRQKSISSFLKKRRRNTDNLFFFFKGQKKGEKIEWKLTFFWSNLFVIGPNLQKFLLYAMSLKPDLKQQQTNIWAKHCMQETRYHYRPTFGLNITCKRTLRLKDILAY